MEGGGREGGNISRHQNALSLFVAAPWPYDTDFGIPVQRLRLEEEGGTVRRMVQSCFFKHI